MSKILVGDVREQLRTLPDASVHCVVTSPPYWGLRDYGVTGQLGLEPTPDEHVAAMVEVFREVWRVLRDDGTAWVNYGDSYATGTNADRPETTTTEGINVPAAWASRNQTTRRHATGLKPKDLVGMPWRVAFALQEDGWYLRSDIIWAKPNPMPESVTDRPTKSHEHIFLLSKGPRYFYDADAVREAATYAGEQLGICRGQKRRATAMGAEPSGNEKPGADAVIADGRNLRDVWTVPTHGFAGCHFATFPPDLIRPCIRAGTSEKGCCPECGAPWVREVEIGESDYARLGGHNGADYERQDSQPGNMGHTRTPNGTVPSLRAAPRRIVGWEPSCACITGAEDMDPETIHSPHPVPATVLDPFFGSGTTGLVCDQENRDWIGIELNPEYADIARKRLHEKQNLIAP